MHVTRRVNPAGFHKALLGGVADEPADQAMLTRGSASLVSYRPRDLNN